jgi:hypothetical protein
MRTNPIKAHKAMTTTTTTGTDFFMRQPFVFC